MPDPLYVAARSTLLDALEAMREHLDAIVLVGAQAVYVHTGEGDLEVAPYTTDGDLALDPERLAGTPLIEQLLEDADFYRSPRDVGAWAKQMVVAGVTRRLVVDLLVPESLGGPGRRAARIPPHHRRSARKVQGLEGTLVDRDVRRIEALDPTDRRSFEVSVAGPAGLLVAKVFKISERTARPDRLTDKDALDVFRLLQAVPTSEFVRRFHALRTNPIAQDATARAIRGLPGLFGSPNAVGCQMAERAAAPHEAEGIVSASLAALVDDFLAALE